MGDLVEHDEAAGAPPPRRSGVMIVVIVVAVALFLGVCLIGILATLLMPALLKAKQKAMATKCSNNLRQIAIAAIMYSDDQRAYPWFPGDPSGGAAFAALEQSGYLDPQVRQQGCPAVDGRAGYEGFAGPIGNDWPSTLPLVWDAAPHADGARNVAFLDGTVSRVSEQELTRLLAELEQEIAQRR